MGSSLLLCLLLGLPQVSESLLTKAELAEVAYGFVVDESLYLTFSSRMVHIRDGKVQHVYDRSGQGPDSLQSGGPIFTVGEWVFCYDVLGQKLLRFDRDLSFQTSVKLRDYLIAGLYFLPTPDNLYAFARTGMDGGLQFLRWDMDSWQVADEYDVPVATKTHDMPIVSQMMDGQRVLFAEKVQLGEDIALHVLDLKTGAVTTFAVFNPEFDPDFNQSTKQWSTYLKLAKYGVVLTAIAGDEQQFYVFGTNHDVGGSGYAIPNGHRLWIINRQTMDLKDVVNSDVASTSGFHHGEAHVLKNDDGEIFIGPPNALVP